MSRMTNLNNVSLLAAVWLAHDDYDYQVEPNYISVTTLIKPIRQIVLGSRIPVEDRVIDVMDRFASRVGTSLHGGVEDAWLKHYRTSLKKLGYPEKVINSIRINPEKEEPDTLPVYLEVRSKREISGFVVGGKMDGIIEGRLHDVKKTSVFKYKSRSSDGKWRLQGSLYRWLNPEKVTHGELAIQYLLLDWSRAAAKRDATYPVHPAPVALVALMGVEETEQWVKEKLGFLAQYRDSPEDQLPDCPEEDLWRTAPVHKYYANPENTGRSTKNFDDLSEAIKFKAEKGKGIIKTVPGEVRACAYCECAPICGQRLRLIADGSIPENTIP